MPKPTEEQLARINKFTQVPRTAENTYVFNNLMIDDQPTSYFSKISPALLNSFVRDAKDGVGLLMNHNSRSLPVGRSFGAHTRFEVLEDGTAANTMYGEFYIPLGRNTESNMTTDDLAAGIDDGSLNDTSIGFNADTWTCTICSNDIRDYHACAHYPGEKYVVTRDGQDLIETCYVSVGEDGKGSLLENSLVYAGAAPRAQITNNTNFSAKDVSELEKGSNLHRVETFKNIPMGTTIYSYYSKNGVELFTETEERTEGTQYLNQRSESKVELQKFMEVLGQFNIKVENEDELKVALAAAVDKSAVEAELAQSKKDLETAQADLAAKGVDLEVVNGELSKRDETISELTKANETLTEKAGLAETYRSDLVEDAIKYGVKAMGNKFNTEMFTKFLNTLSIDEVKEQRDAFKEQFTTAFAGVRTTETAKPVEDRLNAESREDFEDEVEFRNHLAEESLKYSREHKVSISEATKVVYRKYTTKEAE